MFGPGEILSAINVFEKIERFSRWILAKRNPVPETLPARFVRLFESHGVHRNQIPRFFGSRLTISDLHDEKSLVAKLDEQSIEAACETFGVRREWLDGADSKIYSCHSFYKAPDQVLPFLERLHAANPGGDLSGVLLAPKGDEGEAVVVLSERIGSVGERAIYRYHVCNDWTFEYWKSRAYLAAMVAVCIKSNVHIRGTHFDAKEIERIASGEALIPSHEGEHGIRGIRLWHPEDMALRPNVFLKGVDPEREQFGTRSALSLWLHLHSNGYMDTGNGESARGSARVEFERAFEALRGA